MNSDDAEALILIGIFIIIFGYWFTSRVTNMYNSSPYSRETVEMLRDKIINNQKLTFNEKFSAFILDRKVINLFNKIGLTIILVGIALLIIQ